MVFQKTATRQTVLDAAEAKQLVQLKLQEPERAYGLKGTLQLPLIDASHHMLLRCTVVHLPCKHRLLLLNQPLCWSYDLGQGFPRLRKFRGGDTVSVRGQL